MSKAIHSLPVDATTRLKMMETINLLHYLAETVTDKEAAVAFNKEASAPLKHLQRKFDMPCGNVVKVRPKV